MVDVVRGWSLQVCAALLLLVACLLAVGVIPPVKADTFPSATPERAIPVLWGIVFFYGLAGVTLLVRSKGSATRGGLMTTGLVSLALFLLLLAAALVDGAFAYRAHGPAMQSASIFMFVCAAVDVAVSAVVIATLFLTPKPA